MTTLTAAASAVKPTTSSAAAIEPGESRVDQDSHFNGLYETRQNLRIEGLAEGEIRCEGTLTVAEGARVKAKVTASTITIAGELDGEVLCHGVFQIMPTGQVSASVSARRLIVQEGGLYNGEFRMITDATKAESLTASGSAWDSKPDASDGDPQDTIGTDEWWRKLTAGEAVQEREASEPDDSERDGDGPGK